MLFSSRDENTGGGGVRPAVELRVRGRGVGHGRRGARSVAGLAVPHHRGPAAGRGPARRIPADPHRVRPAVCARTDGTRGVPRRALHRIGGRGGRRHHGPDLLGAAPARGRRRGLVVERPDESPPVARCRSRAGRRGDLRRRRRWAGGRRGPAGDKPARPVLLRPPRTALAAEGARGDLPDGAGQRGSGSLRRRRRPHHRTGRRPHATPGRVPGLARDPRRAGRVRRVPAGAAAPGRHHYEHAAVPHPAGVGRVGVGDARRHPRGHADRRDGTGIRSRVPGRWRAARPAEMDTAPPGTGRRRGSDTVRRCATGA